MCLLGHLYSLYLIAKYIYLIFNDFPIHYNALYCIVGVKSGELRIHCFKVGQDGPLPQD